MEAKERTTLVRLLNEIFDNNFDPRIIDMLNVGRLADILIANGVAIVVRCENCDKSNDDVWPAGKIWCAKMCRYMDKNGSCSYGEERQ